MVPTVIITDFPDIVNTESETLDLDKPWHAGITPPTKYKFSLKSGTYEGTMEPQPSPLEPGVWFDYEFAVDHSPESVCGPIESNQEYYWDKDKKEWGVRLNVTDNPVYSRRDKTIVDTPHPDLRENYTFSKPRGNFSVYNEDTDDWEVDYDMVISSLKSNIDMEVRTLNSETIEFKGQQFESVGNLHEYTTLFNATKAKEKIEFYTAEGDLVSLTKEELGELIEYIKVKRSENMNAIKYFKDGLKDVNDKESLHALLTFQSKTRTRSKPTEPMVKLSKLLIKAIEGED